MSGGISDGPEINQKEGEPMPFGRKGTPLSTLATKHIAGNREPVHDNRYITEGQLISTERGDTPCIVGLGSIGDGNSPRRGDSVSPRRGSGEKVMQSTLGKSEWELGEQPPWAQADHIPDFGPASIDHSPRIKSLRRSLKNKSVKGSPRNKSVKDSPSENDTEPWYKGESCTKQSNLGINAVD
jgi:hypothetical protein